MNGFIKNYLNVKRELAYNFSSKSISIDYWDNFDFKKLSPSARWYLVALAFSNMSRFHKEYLLSNKFEVNQHKLFKFAKSKNLSCYGIIPLQILKREIEDYEKSIINKINLITDKIRVGEQLTIL